MNHGNFKFILGLISPDELSVWFSTVGSGLVTGAPDVESDAAVAREEKY